jgi:hypothetical protein
MRVLLLHGLFGGRGRRWSTLQSLVGEGIVARLEAPRLPELQGAGALRLDFGSLVARVRVHLASTRPDLVVAVSMGARAVLATGALEVPALLVAPACAPSWELALAAGAWIGVPRPSQRAEASLIARVPSGSTILSCPDDAFVGPGLVEGLRAGRDDVASVVVPYGGIARAGDGGASNELSNRHARLRGDRAFLRIGPRSPRRGPMSPPHAARSSSRSGS